ncbi:MAG: hypothetical protein JSW23_10870 [Planctomycetota bacterium]|nr:MAG: hypothetical protein JSW23_10870 [Planctomycetota bacterium]
MPVEIKGPHPIASLVGEILYSVGFYLTPIVALTSLISLILSPFRRPKLRNISLSAAGFLIAAFFCVYHLPILEILRSSPHRIYVFRLRSITYIIKDYAEEHQDNLPPAENWCEILADFYPVKINLWVHDDRENVQDPNGQEFQDPLYVWLNDSGPEQYEKYQGWSDYALNENVAGLRLKDIPNDVVLLFETPVAKNPVGGPALMTTEKHDGKGCIILFGDLHLEFVEPQDFNDLRWKP